MASAAMGWSENMTLDQGLATDRDDARVPLTGKGRVGTILEGYSQRRTRVL